MSKSGRTMMFQSGLSGRNVRGLVLPENSSSCSDTVSVLGSSISEGSEYALGQTRGSNHAMPCSCHSPGIVAIISDNQAAAILINPAVARLSHLVGNLPRAVLFSRR